MIIKDSPTKRFYLARLRAADKVYVAAMARPRRRIAIARVKHRRTGDDAALAVALARFGCARERAERARLRRRARAAVWLERQDDPAAFRPWRMQATTGVEVRA